MKKSLLLLSALLVSCTVFGQVPQPLPFSQNWSNPALITVDDNWNGVPGIQGRRGDGITGATGVDPQTLLAADDPGVVDVNANRGDPNTFATGGVTEFDAISNGTRVVALAGSATADAPYLLIGIVTTGLTNIVVTYNVRDIDSSSDNSIQQLALQYRIGNTGAFTNLPAGYIADATTGPSQNNKVTAVNVTLPVAAENEAEVQLRIMTTNAVGNDEWIGIDDISITGTAAACDLTDAGLTDVHCEDNNETANDPTDDYIWFQLNPTGTGLGATYSVSVNVGSVTENSNNPPTNIPYGVSTFFRLQAGSAGGGDVTVTITDDDDDNCTIDVLITDPGSCSVAFCELLDAGLGDVVCNDNETSEDAADDFIVFTLDPTGNGLSGSYSLTVSSGTVTLIDGSPATNIAYGSATEFRLQDGSAGAGNVTVFIEDDGDPECVLSIEIIDPGACSVPCTVGASIAATNEFCVFPGEVQAEGTGGIAPYTYQLTGPNGYDETNLTGLFQNLSAGTYTLTVSDSDDPPCTYTTTIEILFIPDTQAPAFDQNPLPADLLLDCTDPVPPAETLTATDDCDGPVPVDFNEITTPGDCPQEFVITRTWTATDAAGNSNVHTQTITVEDNTPPTLNGLPAASVSQECDEPLPPVAAVTASDDCDSDVPVVFTTSTTPGTCPQEYTVMRTWTATDDCGNAVTFTQTITVTDDTAPVFNQDPLPQDTTVSCSGIPMPEVLDGTDNCDPGIPVPVIFINEIHYDNVGGDVNEFIEIAGTAGINLADYQIVLYNGTGGAPYNTLILNGVIDNEGGSGFGAISFAYPVNGIQNGAPDGIALATTAGMVIQFLSYEGAFNAVGGVANGMLSTDIGVFEAGTEAVGNSLQLTGTGQQYSDFTWVGPFAASAGNLNAGQTINPLPGVIPAMFSQMIESGECNGESTITRMWQLSDACGNSITHTQIITVEDTEGPAFSPPPLPMDTTLSCEQPVPPAPILTAADLCDVPGMQVERVWINEIHYDNVGGDVGEFIEIAGTAGTNLANYTLVLYNGTGGASYNTLVLAGIIPNQANGFGTVCFNYAVNGIQNGAPDGVALVQNAGNMVVQFLSHEGAFLATNGPANGMNSTDIGVDEEPAPAAGNSLYLTGNGDEYSDFTWTGPLAATNCGVNTGQTFIAMSMGPVVTFEETEEPGACPQERFIYRTWTATDDCGNTTVLNQTITIVDDTPPTVNCPSDITLNLDIFGNASLSIGDVNFTYSDNCAPNSSLIVIPFPTQFFDCDDEGLTRQVTISVQDPCGNTGSCTINVTVAPFSRCTPVIYISDPCVCKNNATNLSNGQFGETIKIESLAGKTWTVIANTGFYQANSPAPPAAPILIPIGTTFVETPPGSGNYCLTGIHVDAIGYSITVRSETGQILMISNSCQYPNPTITADLSGPFCLFSEPVILTGTPGDANIVSEGFTVNGVPATVFDPGQGPGLYQIVYTVNGGVPKAFGPDDPGCIQSVSVFVNVVITPSNLVCNDLVHISLDQTCTLEIDPDMILEGSYGCFDDYIVEIDRILPFGNGPWQPGIIDANDIGKTYQVRVIHLVSGNKCWGNIKIEDKLPPELICENFSVPCNTPDLNPNYLFNTLGILAAFPIATDCQNFTLSYIDTQVSLDCASGFTKIITRKWTATDASGNSSTCEQTIGLLRPTFADVTFPTDYDGFDAPGFNCTAAYPTPEWIEDQGLQGFPYVFGLPSGCSINWEYHDLRIEVCDGTYKIRREWTVIDWCLGDAIIFNQLIKVEDKQGPAMTCPPNTTVSVDPFQCCGTINLPDRIIEDACSQVNNISGMVVTFEPQTNQQTGMYTFGGTLQDFPGNNWWDKDTMAVFGFTPCLPIGNQTVTYIATDDCGNSTTCSFKLNVQDLVPPVAVCDQFTTVALTTSGEAIVNASTFDDGSYDNCCLLNLRAARMSSNGCGGTSFATTVPFCCNDLGEIVTVMLRATDCNGNTNECMVLVEVQDKVKPVCVPPAHVTVNCENFDPSLWPYGVAYVEDNCCLDDTKVYQGQDGLTHTANFSLFDTVCNRGTITRTFRAFDCDGQSSQCTQRVIVSYEQDYFVKFPDDAIVTVCDGTGRYGELAFFGEDCELLGISYEDVIYTVVPDACYKIERNWTIINWCTYNPNLDCIYVPNPNPNAIVNHPSNLPGPTVSACGNLPPWKSTIVKINPTEPNTDFCEFYDKDANCYKYKQIIKIIDGQDPVIDNCSSDTLYCDLTTNHTSLWNNMDWWDNAMQSHDLCEGPVDLGITASDACSGPNVTGHYLLFLDLDNNGTMETVINSINPPPPGIVFFNNVNTPNYGGGTPRQFDNRGLPLNQTYQFALLQRFNAIGTKNMFSVRWNTQQLPNVYTVPELPIGTHKIKWFVEDGCGNETFCEYIFTVKDCKPPTVVCLNGLSVNIMPTGMIQMWASDFLQYAEDNCTPAGQLKIGIRQCGTGTGFPLNPDGTPQTSVTFTCAELGTQCVEIWAIDAAGNADYCETFVIVQDNLGNCGSGNINVAGAVKTEMSDGVEEAVVNVNGTSSFTPPYSYFDLSDADGTYQVMNNVPLDASFTIAPEKDDNPLNGVTTYDLVLISQHILGITPLDSPFKIIAADANKSSSVTTFDIVEIRKLILGIYNELPNNDSWRFVDHAFSFPNPNNPFQTAFPETISVADAMTNQMGGDFMGIKVGDVNNSVVANAIMQAEERTNGTALFDLEDRDVKTGEEFEVSFKSAQILKGFQFTITLNGLTAVGTVNAENVTEGNFNLTPTNALAVSIDGAQEFKVRFRAEKAGRLSEMLGVSGSVTRAEAYLSDEGFLPVKPWQAGAKLGGKNGRLGVAFRFDGKIPTIVGIGFELYQNQPNPFLNKTSIGFYLPEAAEATLSVSDEMGRVLYRQKGQFPQGENTVILERSLLNTTGMLYYKLETATNAATKKMIQAN